MMPERTAASRRKQFLRGLQTLCCVLWTGAMLFPLYWMVVTSLKTPQEMLLRHTTFFPRTIYWRSYRLIFSSTPIFRYMLNTIVVTVMQLAVQLGVGIPAAYGFARGKFKGCDMLFVLVLGALMIPAQVTFIPLYIMIANLDLVDTYRGLVFPDMVSAYMIFMLRQNFKSIDESYLDAGKIDGLGILGSLHFVMVPMCKASIITVSLVTIIDGWNNYFWPKILSRTDHTRTIALGLTLLKTTFIEEGTARYNSIMAAAVVSMIPIILIFVFFQKYMLPGYSRAAMK